MLMICDAASMLQDSPVLPAPKTGLDAPKAGVDGVLAAPKLKPEPCKFRKHVGMAHMVGMNANATLLICNELKFTGVDDAPPKWNAILSHSGVAASGLI